MPVSTVADNVDDQWQVEGLLHQLVNDRVGLTVDSWDSAGAGAAEGRPTSDAARQTRSGGMPASRAACSMSPMLEEPCP